MDARRNNVYVGFYENGQAIVPDCHAAFTDVLEQAKVYEKVTFVGEVANFADQIKENLPEATILSSLPSAQLIGRLGLSLPSVDVDAFVPHYLKRVRQRRIGLRRMRRLTVTTTSSASRLSSQEQAQLIYQILSDVYDKSPWTMEQVVADLALDTTEYFYVYDSGRSCWFFSPSKFGG